MFSASPGQRNFEKQDEFNPPKPWVNFWEMLREESRLYPSNISFSPLRLRVHCLSLGRTATIGRLAFEFSPDPANFPIVFDGATISPLYGQEGQGGKLFTNNVIPANPPTVSQEKINIDGNLVHILPWQSAGLDIVGSSALSGNVLSLVRDGIQEIDIFADTNIIKNPIFRVRRKFTQEVTGETVATGNGIDTSFSYTIPSTRRPIAPASVKISFTDSVGIRTFAIRDDGFGVLGVAPPVAPSTGAQLVFSQFLNGDLENSINYSTGQIVLNFSEDHIPAAAAITVDYEHVDVGAQEAPDNAAYRITWIKEEF